jgi:hypothetical protein
VVSDSKERYEMLMRESREVHQKASEIEREVMNELERLAKRLRELFEATRARTEEARDLHLKGNQLHLSALEIRNNEKW